ncbi:hypothetical protein D9Q98_000104 [Chlorella vulgaris]|uniref:Uncharacterized protein n=1 Tax=Chlorella vulgaris TaxID=3077 RepID=A0A9D4TY77_CHLVU|nr:hypothetical protein D9Q98_000104 [Chlorella vulgaris]
MARLRVRLANWDQADLAPNWRLKGAEAEGPGSSSIDTDTSSSGGSSSSSSGDHTRGSSGGVWSDCSPADPPLPHAESRHHRHRVWLS